MIISWAFMCGCWCFACPGVQISEGSWGASMAYELPISFSGFGVVVDLGADCGIIKSSNGFDAPLNIFVSKPRFFSVDKAFAAFISLSYLLFPVLELGEGIGVVGSGVGVILYLYLFKI